MPSTSFMQYEQRAYPIVCGRVYYVGTTSAIMGISAQNEGDGEPGQDTYGVQWQRPFQTLAYALARCVANRGDIIKILPGHTESVASAAAFAFDTTKDGVTVEGLGGPGFRPVITWSTSTAATITVAGDGVTFRNLDLDFTGVDELVVGIAVTGAAFCLDNCRVLLGDSSGQCVTGITLGANADRSYFLNSQFISDTAGASTTLAFNISTADDVYFDDCNFDMIAATDEGCILYSGAALRQRYKDCTFANRIASATTVVDCASLACTGHLLNCKFDIGTIATAGSGVTDAVSAASGWMTFHNCGTINDQAESGGLPGSASTA